MADISPRMQGYYDRLNAGLAQAMEAAQAARKTGLDPETAANNAHAMTPAMPRPPCR